MHADHAHEAAAPRHGPPGVLIASIKQEETSPSSWPPRIARVILAAAACAIAVYLGLYQLHVFDHVWEPFFGDGSHRILRESWISNLLPVPDALVGAAGYLAEGIAAVIGGRSRWHTIPKVVLAESLLIISLAIASILLAVAQPTLFQAGCTLCLITTALSLPPVILAARETRVTVQLLLARRR